MTQPPVFVKIERYREVEDTITQIKTKIDEAKNILEQLNQIKNDEEHEMQNWHEEISKIEDKIRTVEQSLQR